MTGTWHQLYNAGITKIRWPSWQGYIVISWIDGKWNYQGFDGDGKREPRGQRDYLPYAKRRQWESVEEGGA